MFSLSNSEVSYVHFTGMSTVMLFSQNSAFFFIIITPITLHTSEKYSEAVMLLTRETQELLNKFFQKIRLNNSQEASKDKHAKIGQIVSYLEILHAQIRKYSKKRELVFIDCGAGNCYLSYLVYYFYKEIDGRDISIHCLDSNQRLMEKNAQSAAVLGFDNMFFHKFKLTFCVNGSTVHPFNFS